jgi:hypothetical protein
VRRILERERIAKAMSNLRLARARREIDTKKTSALQRHVRRSFTGETYGPQRSTMR